MIYARAVWEFHRNSCLFAEANTSNNENEMQKKQIKKVVCMEQLRGSLVVQVPVNFHFVFLYQGG